MHSLARNHALVNGNERLAWLATVVFADLNGYTVTLTNETAFVLVMGVADDEPEVDDITTRLGEHPPGRG